MCIRDRFNTNFVSRVDETLGLPESIRSTVSDVLQQYTDVFIKSENDRGVSYVVTHKIDIGGEDTQEDHGLQQGARTVEFPAFSAGPPITREVSAKVQK